MMGASTQTEPGTVGSSQRNRDTKLVGTSRGGRQFEAERPHASLKVDKFLCIIMASVVTDQVLGEGGDPTEVASWSRRCLVPAAGNLPHREFPTADGLPVTYTLIREAPFPPTRIVVDLEVEFASRRSRTCLGRNVLDEACADIKVITME
jgi:hypothetical protein